MEYTVYFYTMNHSPSRINSSIGASSSTNDGARLTDKQAEVLEYVRWFIAEQGMPPTRIEIAEGLGFRSPNAAEQHLRALARKGFVEILGGRNRNIQLREPVHNLLSLPLIGRVAAGSPLLAVENVERHYSCADMFDPQADYLLRVRGESMRDAGISDGDLLAVHKTKIARNGQIVVARIDDEVTVKRLELKRGRIRLLPANPDFEPIKIAANRDELSIEGLAVGIVRSLL